MALNARIVLSVWGANDGLDIQTTLSDKDEIVRYLVAFIASCLDPQCRESAEHDGHRDLAVAIATFGWRQRSAINPVTSSLYVDHVSIDQVPAKSHISSGHILHLDRRAVTRKQAEG